MSAGPCPYRFSFSGARLAEGVGFEPTVRFPVRLISSQVPSTAQPPFHLEAGEHSEKVPVVERIEANGRMGEWAKRRNGERASKP
jgi:hypothetical protein